MQDILYPNDNVVVDQIGCFGIRYLQYYFSFILVASPLIHAVLSFLLQVVGTIFFQNHWLLSQIIIVESIFSVEEELSPIVMTISNPGQENSRDGDQTDYLQFLSPELRYRGSSHKSD